MSRRPNQHHITARAEHTVPKTAVPSLKLLDSNAMALQHLFQEHFPRVSHAFWCGSLENEGTPLLVVKTAAISSRSHANFAAFADALGRILRPHYTLLVTNSNRVEVVHGKRVSCRNVTGI